MWVLLIQYFLFTTHFRLFSFHFYLFICCLFFQHARVRTWSSNSSSASHQTSSNSKVSTHPWHLLRSLCSCWEASRISLFLFNILQSIFLFQSVLQQLENQGPPRLTKHTRMRTVHLPNTATRMATEKMNTMEAITPWFPRIPVLVPMVTPVEKVVYLVRKRHQPLRAGVIIGTLVPIVTYP